MPIAPTTATFVNGAWTGNVTVTQAASSMYLQVSDGSGHYANSNSFTVSSLPPMVLTVPTDETEGVGTVAGTVSIPVALASDLTVNFTSSDSSRLSVPATVVISAGQLSGSVPLTIIDDGLLDGPEAVNITASASGYVNGTGTVSVHDYHTAVMTISLPETAHETGGTIIGTVISGAAAARNITVELTSSDTMRLTVPATVTLLADQMSVNFTATLLDDHIIESGETPVTVTSHVENWTDGSATVNIIDDDRTMTVTLPASGWEGQTLSGTVQLGGTLTAPLAVSLSSSDTTQLTLPATVTIAAGSTSATFTATLVDNGLRTGPQTEQITATASGLPTATANVLVKDADVDYYTFTTISSPTEAGVPFAVTADAYDILGNPITVYNGTVTLSGTGTGGAGGQPVVGHVFLGRLDGQRHGQHLGFRPPRCN